MRTNSSSLFFPTNRLSISCKSIPRVAAKFSCCSFYIDHTAGVWPQAAGGVPFSATEFQSSGDAIADLVEDMAAEQKARKTYDNILRLAKDQEVADPIRFLREREIVHFQRFGEALRLLQEELDSKNYYAFNPNFDCMQNTTR